MGTTKQWTRRLQGLGRRLLGGSVGPEADSASEGVASSREPSPPRALRSAASAPAPSPPGSLVQIGGLGGAAAPPPAAPDPQSSPTGRRILEAAVLAAPDSADPGDGILIKAEPALAGDECRFLVNRPILPGRSWLFEDPAAAAASPLAAALLAIDGISSLLVDDTTLVVGRQGDAAADWEPLARQVGQVVRDQLGTGHPAIAEGLATSIPDEDTIRERIQDVIDNEVNPGVAAHSGHISLTRVRGNSVYISMGGGCQGCSAADVTLKQGIHRVFRDAVPEVGAIYDETDHAAGTNPYFS